MGEKKAAAGITLVALVVTIVVLLILSGITIMYVSGENSIIKKAQEARNNTEQAIQREQDEIGELANLLNKEYGGGQGSDTEGPIPEVPVEEIRSDWEKINKIAKAIASDSTITYEATQAKVTVEGKSYTIKVGDIFEVQYNGEARRVRVLGFNHDRLVNKAIYGGQHSNAGISFEFYDFMLGTTPNKINTSATNTEGWAVTQMRKDLNGYTTDDVVQNIEVGGQGANLSNQQYIKQVVKTYITTYNIGGTSSSNDYLWLLSCSEVWNSGYSEKAYGYAITKEGHQYQYYRGINPTWNEENTNFIKKPNDSGTARDWWLRSPGYSGAGGFCYAGTNGKCGIEAATLRMYVAPGFCV